MLLYQEVMNLFDGVNLPENQEIALFKANLAANVEAQEDENILRVIIKEYLRLRWTLIKNTSLAYPLSPNDPVNRFNIRLAETIVQKNETIIQLLIPTLLEREYLIGNLRGLTEDETEGKRSLSRMDSYLLLEDNTTVLPLIDWFSYQSDPSHPHYHHLYTQGGEVVPLTGDEKSLIRKSCGAASEELFEQHEYYRELSVSTNTLYGAIKHLMLGLMKGSVSNERNSGLVRLRHRIAGPESNEAAEKFIARIAAIPPSACKEALLDLRAELFSPTQEQLFGSKRDFEKHYPSLGDYLLVLRHSMGHSLTEQEVEKCQEQELLNCVEEICLGLNNIVIKNRVAFEQLRIDTIEETVFVQAKPALSYEQALGQVFDYLKDRPVDVDPTEPDLKCSTKLYLSLISQLGRKTLLIDLSSLADLVFLHQWHTQEEFLGIVRALSPLNKDGYLLLAAKSSAPQVIPLLIEGGADYTQPISESNLLTIALENNWTEVLETLYQKNLSLLPFAWDENTITPLHVALQKKNTEAFGKILENIEKHTDKTVLKLCLMIEDTYADNLIYYIVKNGSKGVIDTLVNKGLRFIFEEKNSLGKTALHQAVHGNHIEMLKKVIEVIPPEMLLVKNGYGQTPFESAIHSAKRAEAEILLQAYEQNHYPVGDCLNLAYTEAMNRKQVNWLYQLLERDQKQEIRLSDSNNGLELAMRYGHLDLINLLIKRGANLEARAARGSLLHYALTNNWSSVLTHLIKLPEESLKALMNSRSAENQLPLEVAHEGVDPEIRASLEKLFKHEANPEEENHTNKRRKL